MRWNNLHHRWWCLPVFTGFDSAIQLLGERFAAWYNISMTVEQFKTTLHLQPFRPFTIRMADGRMFDVPHPDLVAKSPSGRTVIVFQQDDSYSLLDLLLMTEVEVHASNGRSS